MTDFRHFQQKTQAPDLQDKTILVGLSGGADSVALLLLLAENRQNFHLEAVHFHHHLRDSADNDALFCQELCLQLQIPFRQIDLNVTNENAQGIEANARQKRLDYYQEECCEPNTIIALAHHRDDVRENFLLRALRGSNAGGLTALREHRQIQGVSYWRPLLSYGKEQLTAFLQQKEQTWCEDESNLSYQFRRNFMRHEILPALATQADLKGLDKTLLQLSKDAAYLDEQAEDFYQKNGLKPKSYLKAPAALRGRILRFLFEKHGILPYENLIERLLKECLDLTSIKEISVDDQHCLYLSPNEDFRLVALKDRDWPAVKWNWGKEQKIKLPFAEIFVLQQENELQEGDLHETFSTKGLSETLELRPFLGQGERLQPKDKNKEHKVKDLFTKKKIKKYDKHRYPLLYSDEQCLWIPGISRSIHALPKEGEEHVCLVYRFL